jgi:Ser/Thr protein kinase RdoA (MazF antagonist)
VIETLPDFSALSPSDVADAAEAVLDVRVEPVVVPYPSYINRVYGLADADGKRYIAKFYRPGRWPEAAIRQEHAFVLDCAAAGADVLCPIPDPDGDTLSAIALEDAAGAERVFYFAIYPFLRGRGWEPESDDDWLSLGRRIAVLHTVGAGRACPERPVFLPKSSAGTGLERLLNSGVVAADVRSEFADLCVATLQLIAPRFDGVPLGALHGDLHRGNAFATETGNPVFIDFDDMGTGPAVQDLWLFLPGRREDSRREFALLAEGYGEVRLFDPAEADLIEPLRFMRMLSYLDWQARQRFDAGFARSFPDWGTRPFWIKELEDFRDQARVIAAERS